MSNDVTEALNCLGSTIYEGRTDKGRQRRAEASGKSRWVSVYRRPYNLPILSADSLRSDFHLKFLTLVTVLQSLEFIIRLEAGRVGGGNTRNVIVGVGGGYNDQCL